MILELTLSLATQRVMESMKQEISLGLVMILEIAACITIVATNVGHLMSMAEKKNH